MKYIIFANLLFLAIAAYGAEANASPECDHPNFYIKGCDNSELVGPAGPAGPVGPMGPQGEQGIPGADGTDGVAADLTGLATTTSVESVQEDLLYNDNRLIGGMAGLAATAAIPDVKDGMTGIGIGFSNYRGVNGIAMGIVHKVEALTLKGSISTNSIEQDDWILSAGGTFGF